MSFNYAIRRAGEFAVHFTGTNANQCGNVGTPILKYDVEIITDQDGLDEGGWVLDNNEIPSYFRKRYESIEDFPSCEAIAAEAVEAFKLLVGPSPSGKKCRAKIIRVTVSGIPSSGITAVWRDYDTESVNVGVTL